MDLTAKLIVMAGKYPGLAYSEVCGERLEKQGRIIPLRRKNGLRDKLSLVGT